MSFNSFLVVLIGFSLNMIISFTKREIYFFLSSLDAFYFFFLLKCSASTSNTMLSGNVGSGHSCVVPELWEEGMGTH